MNLLHGHSRRKPSKLKFYNNTIPFRKGGLMISYDTVQNIMDALAIKRWGIITLTETTRRMLKQRGVFHTENSILDFEPEHTYSVLSIAVPYALKGYQRPEGQFWGEIDPYAWHYDYHVKVKALLNEIWIKIDEANASQCANTHQEGYMPRMYVDQSPFNDREVAFYTGLGTVGYNHLMIEESSGLGSAFFIGYILLPEDIRFSEHVGVEVTKLPESLENPFCQSCQKCVAACPSSVCGSSSFDMSRCLSAVTQTKEIVSEADAIKFKSKIYGCNICQVVCPFNKQNALMAELDEGRGNWVDLIELLTLSSKKFKEKYGQMGFAWRSLWIYKRNALIVLGNVGGVEELNFLRSLNVKDLDPKLEEYYKFAIKRISERHLFS